MDIKSINKVIPQEKILTPSEVNQIARELLETLTFWVRGEVFDLKRDKRYFYVYFGLKDNQSQVRCVARHYLFDNLDFKIEEGSEILVLAKLSIYEAKGEFQLKVLEIKPIGKGSLYEELERLKAKLQEEGLFDLEHKKTLPQFPEKIGLITSARGAAFKDVQKVIRERYPLVELVLVDVLVEGKEAPGEIIKAIKLLNQRNDIDVIILTRGGGSPEDLLPFSTEEVARAIFNSKIPVICAIGHEKDVSIAELVADLRAATPSHAAQLAVPDKFTLLQRIDEVMRKVEGVSSLIKEHKERLDKQMKVIEAYLKVALDFKKEKLRACSAKVLAVLQRFEAFLSQTKFLSKRIKRGAFNFLSNSEKKISTIVKLIELLDPYYLLQKGYTITYNLEGKIVKFSKDLKIGENIFVRFQDGKIKSKVLKKEYGK